MAKPRQVKDIIRYIDACVHCVIWHCDVYIDPAKNEEPEKIFEGAIMDIPWYILDFYFYNDENGEAIDVRLDDGRPIMVISVVQDKNRLNK